MRELHISYSGASLDYKGASGLAASLAASTLGVSDPVMVALARQKGVENVALDHRQ